MLAIRNMLEETSVVVENIFVLGLVKSGFTTPKALTKSFVEQGDSILYALGRENEDCMTGEQDILDFLCESEQSGYLIEFSHPAAKDICLDANGNLAGYAHDLTTKLSAFFYSDTLEDCVMKAVAWHDTYIIEQFHALN